MVDGLNEVEIAPLEENHLRGEFSCGNERIDAFLTKRAWKDHCENKVRVRVAHVENEVIGFYSLSLKTLAAKAIGGKIGSKFGSWPIPSVYLAMIGTHVGHQGKGIGIELMRHAFERTLEVADIAGTACMTLDAVDEKRAKWYEKLSFRRIADNGLAMYIPLATLRQACKAARDGGA